MAPALDVLLLHTPHTSQLLHTRCAPEQGRNSQLTRVHACMGPLHVRMQRLKGRARGVHF